MSQAGPPQKDMYTLEDSHSPFFPPDHHLQLALARLLPLNYSLQR